MNAFITTRLIKIGNSQGIRIPKLLIEQAGLSGDIEIEMQSDQLILRSIHSPRHNWEEQFNSMSMAGDDILLDGNALTSTYWESSEWEW